MQLCAGQRPRRRLLATGEHPGGLDGGAGAPAWELSGSQVFEADPVPAVRERYAEVRDLTARRPPVPRP